MTDNKICKCETVREKVSERRGEDWDPEWRMRARLK